MPKKATAVTVPDPSGSNSTATLLSSIERIMSLTEEIEATKEQQKEEFAAIKSMGFDTKIVRAVIKRMNEDPDARAEHEMLVETYEAALEAAKLKRI